MDDLLKLSISFLAGFFSSVFSEPIRRFIFQARIGIKFAPEMSMGNNYICIMDDEKDGVDTISKYIRAEACNHSRFAPAKECQAFMVKLEKKSDDGVRRLVCSDPLPLFWSHRGTEPLTIYRGMPLLFDIFYVAESSNSIRPQTVVLPSTWENLLKEPALYSFTIAVVGANMPPAFATITVNWKGSFDQLTIDSFDYSNLAPSSLSVARIAEP